MFASKLALIVLLIYCSALWPSSQGSKIDELNQNAGSGISFQPIGTNMDKLEDDLSSTVLFYLYTRKNKDNFQQLIVNNSSSVKSSNFDSNLPTTFVVHGYMDNIYAEIIQIIKNNILEKVEQNVFGIDWSAYCMTILYNDAVTATKPVGDFLGSFIKFMVSQGLDLRTTHLIGHSLGAHVAGFAGGSLSPNKPARVTGLDPAKPGFEDAGPTGRLDASNADFVDCIHTCAGDLGLGKPVCHADFYPNGGENVQPGCPWYDFAGTCSHSRSYEYYAESIQVGHEFGAVQCYEAPIDGPQDRCNLTFTDEMGEPANVQLGGLYYVSTNTKYPFAQN